MWTGPVVACTYLGEGTTVRPLLEAASPLANVSVGGTTIPSLPLDLQPAGKTPAEDVALNIFVFSCATLTDYKTRVAPSLSRWRAKLEERQEWYILEVSGHHNDEVWSACRQEFYSREPGDRAAAFGRETGAWVAAIKGYIERGFSSRLQECVAGFDAAGEGALKAIFLARDECGCLYESFGLLGEALGQYKKLAAILSKYREQVRTRPPALAANARFLNRDVHDIRASVRGCADIEEKAEDLGHYLFSRQSHLLFRLGRPVEALKAGLDIIHATLARRASAETIQASGKMWGARSCQEMIATFRDQFGGAYEEPELEADDDIERVATLVAEALELLSKLLLEIASQAENLATSHVWAVRRRDDPRHGLVWGCEVPSLRNFGPFAISAEEPRKASAFHDSGLHSDGRDIDWLDWMLSAPRPFEITYSRCLQTLAAYRRLTARRYRFRILAASEVLLLCSFRRCHITLGFRMCSALSLSHSLSRALSLFIAVRFGLAAWRL